MIIDLASPLWGSIAAGLFLMIIAGTYHYIVTLITLYEVNKKFGNVLSEMDMLHKDYKKEISKIRKDTIETLTHATETAFVNRLDEIIKHNQPPLINKGLVGLLGIHPKDEKNS